ncbi:MAG: serine/threonine-protein phosphatase [Gammaproteobacteria bacterium]|nr:serine/threonine-protein phosphatase [Gammaproteobacteria bacterium]
MKYQVAQFSVVGGRSTNEDCVGIAERPNAVILVLADGLGGHTGGELASQTAVETVLKVFQGVKQARLQDPFAFLALTLLQAHRAIVARAQMHVPPLEARTTCVVCLVQDGYAYWAHVGDSRLYHFRRARMLKRTEDHTPVEELRRDGIISEEEMASHPRKSYLLRSLGGNEDPRISLGEETPLHTDDMLLLCSDGLWEALTAEQILVHLEAPKLEDGVEEMLFDAEKRMGHHCDNVTVACLRWEDRAVRALPRHTQPASQIDSAQLYRGAAAKVAAQRNAPTPKEKKLEERKPDTSANEQTSIENRIQELEDFLRKFEPK